MGIARDHFSSIRSSGSDRIQLILKCKEVHELGVPLEDYGIFGAWSNSPKPITNTKLVDVEYEKGAGKIPKKLLDDLRNPGGATILDKPETLEGHQVDWVLVIGGGDGGEVYWAHFGFRNGRLKIRVIYGEPGGPPLAEVREKTVLQE